MPGVQGFSGLIYLRAQHPDVPVVIVSATEDPLVIRRAIDFGASGFIPEIARDSMASARRSRRCLPAIPGRRPTSTSRHRGQGDRRLIRRLATLTPQQVRVLMMLSEGLLNKQIAYELGVSEATVKAHVSAILQKLGVDSRTQAVIAASKIGATLRPAATAPESPEPAQRGTEPGMNPNLQRFLGGSPGAVLVKLIFLSLLVGAFMALIGITPVGLFERILRMLRDVFDLGFESIREVGRWLLYGAMIVVPLWLLSRLFARRR